MNIAFLTSGHLPFDDRIYYHMAMTLAEEGHNILIISSRQEIIEVSGRISINSFYDNGHSKKDKITSFSDRLEAFTPDIAICSEPLPLIAAKRYRRKASSNLRIVYDITEWYPSGRFLGEYRSVFRLYGFVKLLLINISASLFADAFIFGEYYKSKPYRFLFPFSPGRFITYYPDLKYVDFKESSLPDEKLRLSYSGEISIDKGFGYFMKVVNGLADMYPYLEIEVRLVAWYGSEKDTTECEPLLKNDSNNITIYFAGRQKYSDFTGQINETDIFLDLRKVTFENNHSLPIKLFYYAALGRPVIFSDLKAVRRDVEVEKFGFLTDPGNAEGIILLISNYLKDPCLYKRHCENARALAIEKYNWSKISPEFLNFIESV